MMVYLVDPAKASARCKPKCGIKPLYGIIIWPFP
jgi:hypothetical protein